RTPGAAIRGESAPESLVLLPRSPFKMTTRRCFTLAALCLAASLSLGGRARAGYDYSTSVPAANVTGASGSVTVSTATSFIDPRLGTVATPYGFTTFTDLGGSTIYLVNAFSTNFPVGGSPSSPLENVLVSSSPTTTDSSTWNFTEVITITNPSA